MTDRRREIINTSGFNMYPSQVKDVIRNVPGVRDIAVTDLPAGSAGENMVTTTIPEADVSVILTDVRRWTKKSIVHYVLPRQIVVMAELPRSQLGEVMCKKVREQILDTADSVLTVAGQVRNTADQMYSAIDQARSAIDSTAASAIARFRSLKNRE